MRLSSSSRQLIIISLSCLILAACNHFKAKDTNEKKSQVTGPKKKFTVKLPTDWIRKISDRKSVTASKDGSEYQLIRVSYLSHKKSFKTIKEKSNADMLPSELAELMIAKIRKSKLTRYARIIENKPASIGGKKGFRLKLSFKSPRGEKYLREVYGVTAKKGNYFIIYQAPAKRYFKQHKGDFNKTLESFRLSKKTKQF